MRIRLRAVGTSFQTGKPGVKQEVKTSHEDYVSTNGNKDIPGKPEKRNSKLGVINRFEMFSLLSLG